MAVLSVALFAQERTTTNDCPPSLPGRARPLEAYAQRFDPLFSSLAQRRGFRDYRRACCCQGIRTRP